MAITTEGTEWHQSNRGVSIYITLYLSLFLLVVIISVRVFDKRVVDVDRVSGTLLKAVAHAFLTFLCLSMTEIPS